MQNCLNAATYTIQEQRLYLNGVKFTQTGDTLAVFSPSIPETPVDRAFSLKDGILHWRNPSFVGDEAQFCIRNGIVNVVFNGVYPVDCQAVRLKGQPVDGRCQRIRLDHTLITYSLCRIHNHDYRVIFCSFLRQRRLSHDFISKSHSHNRLH